MENKSKDTRFLIVVIIFVAILFVSAIAETISYYNGTINDRNSKIALMNTQIANLNNEIANLNSQISNLTGQVANLTYLTSANLVTNLNVTDAQVSTENLLGVVSYLSFYCLDISGNVTNTGGGTAYNAGLHVVAYDNSILEVNMTVPLVGSGMYGTDATTDAYVSPFGDTPTHFGSLGSGTTTAIGISIYHEGTVTNWTVTPVWTNSP